MRFTIPLSLVSVAHAWPQGPYWCDAALEIVQIQDLSGTNYGWAASLPNLAEELTEKMNANFPMWRWATVGYSDKPIPYSGWGHWGNQKWGGEDFCYQFCGPLTNDTQELKNAWSHFAIGAGNDFTENPLEAVLLSAVDPQIGWSEGDFMEIYVDDYKRDLPIRKIALIITDDLAHRAPDAKTNIDLWNAPRTYEDPTYSRGGWGSLEFQNSHQVFFDPETDREYYLELSALLNITDNGGTLTPEEQTRLDELILQWGPEKFPEPVPHPGDFSIDCALTEYPTLDQVAAILEEKHITPIIILFHPSYGGNMTWTVDYYTDLFSYFGVPNPTVVPFSEDWTLAIDDLINLLIKATELCPVQTPNTFPPGFTFPTFYPCWQCE
eukprot:Gregarina_sp_Pseudo_9__1041@NODE_1675_length_1408_cov_776_656684_g1552_i0_p1_GENE_NODE_1675_length_1408_cov_776_656684_g1552_i0NODE_1675_length_1408_cov_776_656684_g1552_i0_p1_ORF_typecomplete_len381_score63_27Integrin_beta/PF00362_18/1_1e10Integrin_beta/PF00362_18/0_5_NODE_1675_length_1408_cov_776_656684_g1552_i02101352